MIHKTTLLVGKKYWFVLVLHVFLYQNYQFVPPDKIHMCATTNDNNAKILISP